MPELPEVEVVRQGLSLILKDQPLIQDIEFYRANLRDPMPKKQLRLLIGSAILAVHRRAKYLLFETSKGYALSHLGMTGSWRVSEKSSDEKRKHDHVALILSNGQRLIYCDPRRFGVLDFASIAKKDIHPRLQHLGVEPLSADFTGAQLWSSLRKKKCSIKAAIMDQKVVVGVGNIYAAEALFGANIHPLTRACQVSLSRCEKLVSAIQQILKQAIAAGGSSISDFKQATGDSGYFQAEHRVYDRASLPCVICATNIRRRVIAGRSSFWCPQCQKK